MDNYPIKSVAFGGFDKQDVIRYIEKAAYQATAQEEELQAEIAALRAKEASLSEELNILRGQLEESTAQCKLLEKTLHEETASRMALEPLKGLDAEVAQLRSEIESLRPDAEAYAQFREKLGAIECESRKRAADLEMATVNQLQQTVDLFRAQYQILMSTFESTANHVTSELRKVEVNLTQLPRAMDQAGSELNTLAAQLRSEEN